MLEPDPQAEEIRRLRAQRVEWANMATIARLDRDRLVSELASAKKHAEYLGEQNQSLWVLVSAVEGLFSSRTWSSSSLSESDAGPVNRLRHQLTVIRREASGNTPLNGVHRISDPGLK